MEGFTPCFLCFVPPPFIPDLIHCTNELNVSIPHLADTLLERTASNSWIVVFKALITTHHLMMYGNEVSTREAVGACTHVCMHPNTLHTRKRPLPQFTSLPEKLPEVKNVHPFSFIE